MTIRKILLMTLVIVCLHDIKSLLAEEITSTDSSLKKSSSQPAIAKELIGYNEQDRFSLQSPIEHLEIGGYLQVDGRLFIGAHQNPSTFLIRRARLYLSGTLYQRFGFMLMPRWDRTKEIGLHYAWLETLCPSWGQIRVGLFKEPFSLEALNTDLYLNFVERSLVIRNLHHIEDIGVMVYGDLFKDSIEYGIGYFNGRGKELDNNSNKELATRFVFASPTFYHKHRFYVGLSFSTGRFDDDLSGQTFETGSDTIFWTWTDIYNDPVEVHSNRIRLGCDLEWFSGPFYFSAEYLYTSWGNIYMDHRSAPFHANGGYIQASYLLTGEDKPRNDILIPKHSFDGCTHWGALEIAARYEFFYASKKMIDLGFASGANQSQGPTIAINWYLNPLITIKLDGQYLHFNRRFVLHDHEIQHESVVTCRVQGVF